MSTDVSLAVYLETRAVVEGGTQSVCSPGSRRARGVENFERRRARAAEHFFFFALKFTSIAVEQTEFSSWKTNSCCEISAGQCQC